ncbi:hypothetical protein AAKU64_001644 [Undibacterium sp. GrIS 1.8]|uniref:AIPR family protein n=1 Tax=unclassified Undibacterium TaxID=2630295 RepID=UPI0033955F85
MSVIHVNQIRNRLKQLFEGKIDLADQKSKLKDDLESVFLSRSLAAYSIYHLTSLSEQEAAESITDGYDDNGIDAIAYDKQSSSLYLVQTKWIKSGEGEPDLGSVKKFIAGIHDLLSLNLERFNAKVNARAVEIEDALNSSSTKIVVILAHTGTSKLSIHAERDFSDLKNEVNDAGEILSISILNQSLLHKSLSENLNDPISAELQLRYWGKKQNPSYAVYGQICASDLAQLWGQHKERLLALNLRGSLGDTDVNAEIRETLTEFPENFWYFNNGITAIASSVKKTAKGGSDTEVGTFACEDLYVVNGAQTISTIGRFAEAEPSVSIDKAYVQIRIVSLDGADINFGDNITKTNNRQNKIDNRDFVAQDTEQKRIKSELAIDGINYVIMRNDEQLSTSSSFDLQESTTALACASLDVSIIVQVKGQIGKVWEDLTRPPYKTLFNPSTTGILTWRAVVINRKIENQLSFLEKSYRILREQKIVRYGNRLISGLVFQHIPKNDLNNPSAELKSIISDEKIVELTNFYSAAVVTYVQNYYENAMIPSLFKNQTKCKDIYSQMLKKMP